jgi:CRP-like cAMP-binding protein
VTNHDELHNTLASLTLFSDLTGPQLEGVAHIFQEEWFSAGQRILRQGFAGTGFYVILEGEAAVHVDGSQRATLGRGDFFGEMSALLTELPSADVLAVTDVRCVALGGPELAPFLLEHPRVMLRMLQAVARRLRSANQWRS